VQPGRKLSDAVEIASDADVVHSGHRADVLDVVGHI